VTTTKPSRSAARTTAASLSTPGTTSPSPTTAAAAADSLALFVNGEAVPYEGANESFFDLMGEIATRAPAPRQRRQQALLRRRQNQRSAPLPARPRRRRSPHHRPLARTHPRRPRRRRALLPRQRRPRRPPGLSTPRRAHSAERLAIRRRAAITHVMQEKTNALPMSNILYRGQYDQPRDKVEPAVPGVLPPSPPAPHEPPRPRPMARRRQQPPHRPRRRQPLLAGVLRRRHRQNRRRLRQPGRSCPAIPNSSTGSPSSSANRAGTSRRSCA
jgi:hypothetical protein